MPMPLAITVLAPVRRDVPIHWLVITMPVLRVTMAHVLVHQAALTLLPVTIMPMPAATTALA